MHLKNPGRERIGHKQITWFTHHLAVLLAADLRVGDALQLIAGSPGNRAASHVASSLLAQLQEGLGFGEAIARYPHWFNPVYRQLAATGEITGQLPSLMQHLADYRAASEAITARIKRASGYPLVILLFAGVMMIGLLALVVPRFRELFADSGASLPLITRLVVRLSDLLVTNGLLLLLVAIVLIGLMILLGRMRMLRLPLLRVTYELPFIGGLSTMRQREHFLRSLALMVAARLPLTQSIERLATSANMLWQPRLQRISQELHQGESLDQAMRASGLFAEADLFAARIGWEGARLDTLLLQQADQYAGLIEQRLQRLVLLLEPGLMLCIGMMIALIVLAVYLPLFSIGQAL